MIVSHFLRRGCSHHHFILFIAELIMCCFRWKEPVDPRLERTRYRVPHGKQATSKRHDLRKRNLSEGVAGKLNRIIQAYWTRSIGIAFSQTTSEACQAHGILLCWRWERERRIYQKKSCHFPLQVEVLLIIYTPYVVAPLL